MKTHPAVPVGGGVAVRPSAPPSRDAAGAGSPRSAAPLALALTLALLPGCAALSALRAPGMSGAGAGARPSAPLVRLVEVRATHRPTDAQIAAHFCLQEVSRSPLGPAGGLICRAFGPLPSEHDLQFRFDIELEAENPGAVPLPMVAALVAFTAFPDEPGADNLGTLCLSLCETGESCPSRGDDACRSNLPDIRDVDDFARATVGFLVGLATGTRSISDLRVRTIAPSDRVSFVASLGIGVGPMMHLIEHVATGVVESARTGRQPELVIPWAVEGTIFVEVEAFGRFAASFPEARGSWDLDAGR